MLLVGSKGLDMDQKLTKVTQDLYIQIYLVLNPMVHAALFPIIP